jgi:hypothetical protein
VSGVVEVVIRFKRTVDGQFGFVKTEENIRRMIKAIQIYEASGGVGARAYVQSRLDHGVDCPTCDKWAQKYNRQIYATVAASLVVIYRMSGGDTGKYIHTTDMVKYHPVCINGRSDFPKLLFWGLIEAKPFDAKDAARDVKQSGWWRITGRGVDFVLGKIKVAKWIVTYNDIFLGFKDEEQVSIHDCMNEKFSYSELMGFPVQAAS